MLPRSRSRRAYRTLAATAPFLSIFEPEFRTARHLRVARSLHFSPGQKTGLHFHPCPTITYIVGGSAIVQLEGELEQKLHAGQAFYEPAGVKVLRFDNASSRVSLHFIAVYLVKGDEPLIEMLE
jgi:quercetin dioxygenase-like cupin family protein